MWSPASLYSDARCSYGLYSYGLYSYGLCSYGLYSYGLYSYGLYGDGQCSYGLYSDVRCSHGLHSCGRYSYGLVVVGNESAHRAIATACRRRAEDRVDRQKKDFWDPRWGFGLPVQRARQGSLEPPRRRAFERWRCSGQVVMAQAVMAQVVMAWWW